jgi:asparagine synthase (glutamine-hydrolysing)
MAAIRIVYNGEVYNFAEQRRVLEGSWGAVLGRRRTPRSCCDLYERFGDDFVVRLARHVRAGHLGCARGPGLERFVLARDHMGIKPCSTRRWMEGSYSRRSSRRCSRAGLVAARVDATALRTLLTYGSVLQPRTDPWWVKALLPGHRIVVERGCTRVERYWALGTDRRRRAARSPVRGPRGRCREALEESARLQLVSDVPLGAFLSGGGGLVDPRRDHDEGVGTPVRTFSVGFAGAGRRHRRERGCRADGAHLGTQHTTSVVRGEDVRDRIAAIAARSISRAWMV